MNFFIKEVYEFGVIHKQDNKNSSKKVAVLVEKNGRYRQRKTEEGDHLFDFHPRF